MTFERHVTWRSGFSIERFLAFDLMKFDRIGSNRIEVFKVLYSIQSIKIEFDSIRNLNRSIDILSAFLSKVYKIFSKSHLYVSILTFHFFFKWLDIDLKLQSLLSSIIRFDPNSANVSQIANPIAYYFQNKLRIKILRFIEIHTRTRSPRWASRLPLGNFLWYW